MTSKNVPVRAVSYVDWSLSLHPSPFPSLAHLGIVGFFFFLDELGVHSLLLYLNMRCLASTYSRPLRCGGSRDGKSRSGVHVGTRRLVSRKDTLSLNQIYRDASELKV